jgi:peptidoglycan hydrolase-like protein with peptidoglycan-binding domain
MRDPYSLAGEPIPGDSMVPSSGTENIRWAQDCLNHTMELRLVVNGVMGADTRSALRRFQGQQGLRVTGILGPDTEEALKSACSGDGVTAQAQTEFYATLGD